MNRYIKISAALAAFALLLVVMGLSTSGSVNAQTVAPTSICSNNSAGCTIIKYGDHDANDDADEMDMYYIGSPAIGKGPTVPSATDHNNVFTFSGGGNGMVEIYNLDLARVVDRNNNETVADTTDDFDNPDANPKRIGFEENDSLTIVAVHQSSGLFDNRTGDIYQVKAFNGNRIQVTYSPAAGNTFATIKRVTVDNVRPALITQSPAIPLIVRGNTDVTFSADFTDGGAGFDAKFDPGLKGDLDMSPHGILNTLEGTANNVTAKGGIRLVVAGNVVELVENDFTKIDGGWTVSKTVNSNAMQSIAPNVPWYFEVRDRANNSRRTSGTVKGRTSVAAAATDMNFVDKKFQGKLVVGAFLGSLVRITSGGVESNWQPITAITASNGTITVTNTDTDSLWNDAVDTAADPDDPGNDIYEGFQCPFTDPPSETGEQRDNCAIPARSSYEIRGTNLITVDTEEPDLVSGTAIETGIGVDLSKDPGKRDVENRKNSIKITFADTASDVSPGNGAPGSGLDKSSVSPSAFSVSGNTVESTQVDGNKVYLTLSDNLGSTEKPTVSIQSGVIKDKAGNAYGGGRESAHDSLGPNLSLSKSGALSNDEITVTITTDEQLNAIPMVYVTMAAKDGKAPTEGTDAIEGVRQTGALTYAFDYGASDGGEFSVHATGADTAENGNKVGSSTSSVSPSSFIFELDKKLNGGDPPVVSVSDNEDVFNDDSSIEQVDPMIVTVDFSGESGEYGRDSYKTVELTLAKLKITFSNGTSETKTFNLTTEVSSPDNIKFTIPMLNPKIGTYDLTVQAQDQAGNVRTDGTGTTAEDLKVTWKVIAPSPVDIDLAPGWNLVSLPFQPANPATNSVVRADHPASIIMTFDNASQVWLVSRRDAETGLFVGDITVMTASTAYFIRTENFEPITMLRPPLSTAAAAPPPPPAITVVKGWNLVPIVSNAVPTPDAIAADAYFGTLGSGGNAGWLKALTFDTLVRTWISVTPGSTSSLSDTGTNPCTGETVDKDKVEAGNEPCQIGQYEERSTSNGDVRVGDSILDTTTTDDETDTREATDDDAKDGGDGYVGDFDGNDRVVIGTPVEVGKGYWLYSTVDGVIIP